jgi:hypothetical protein
VSERFEKLVFKYFLEDRMDIKNLMLHDDLASLTDGKEHFAHIFLNINTLVSQKYFFSANVNNLFTKNNESVRG